MARKGRWWEDHLNQVLLTKPAEVVQEACQVIEKHGCLVKEKLKSELYYVRIVAQFAKLRSVSYVMPTCSLTGITVIG